MRAQGRTIDFPWVSNGPPCVPIGLDRCSVVFSVSHMWVSADVVWYVSMKSHTNLSWVFDTRQRVFVGEEVSFFSLNHAVQINPTVISLPTVNRVYEGRLSRCTLGFIASRFYEIESLG